MLSNGLFLGRVYNSQVHWWGRVYNSQVHWWGRVYNSQVHWRISSPFLAFFRLVYASGSNAFLSWPALWARAISLGQTILHWSKPPSVRMLLNVR